MFFSKTQADFIINPGSGQNVFLPPFSISGYSILHQHLFLVPFDVPGMQFPKKLIPVFAVANNFVLF